MLGESDHNALMREKMASLPIGSNRPLNTLVTSMAAHAFTRLCVRKRIHCSRKRVVRLMQTRQLSARRPSHRIVTTRSEPGAHFAPNLLDRHFDAEAPNKKWVADVTFIATREGWLYLAAVLDLFSRAIVGWEMAAIQDEQLVEQALNMALVCRRPHADLLHHSDRGCQYTSQEYQALLISHGIRVSMSRKGNCYDNAVMERFFGTLKGECVTRFVFETREQAQHVVFEYALVLL